MPGVHNKAVTWVQACSLLNQHRPRTPPPLTSPCRLLKAKLEAMGVRTFVPSVDSAQGEQVRRTIARSLDECKWVAYGWRLVHGGRVAWLMGGEGGD